MTFADFVIANKALDASSLRRRVAELEDALRRLTRAASLGDGSAAYRDGAGVRLTAHPAYDHALAVLDKPEQT